MKRNFVIFAFSLLLFSCQEKPVKLPWETDDPSPIIPVDPSEPSQKDRKPAYVWIDASANFQYFANDRERIASDLAKVKEMGFTDVILDVRPTEGVVLYKSKVCPEAKKLAAWVDGNYKFVIRTATWDYLQAFIEEGHALGLKVNAAINTFVGGYGGQYGLESIGPIFTGDIPTSWATEINETMGIVSTYSDNTTSTVFLNPANPEVQDYVLQILAEIAAYDVDGIVLDRCRYDDNGLKCDFSDISKAAFAKYLGKDDFKWPVFDKGTEQLPTALTSVQKSWLSFRIKTIHDFVERAAATVHSVNPKVRFGAYVGAWYSSYYSSGVNWASPKYRTDRYYPQWADEDYHNYGYADHCDFMFLGCYASASSIYGSGEWTMEGFCKNGRELLCGDTLFAGGPDVGNPTGWDRGGQGRLIPDTIDACIHAADGYFLFDLCHIRMYDYWDYFKLGFDNYLKSL